LSEFISKTNCKKTESIAVLSDLFLGKWGQNLLYKGKKTQIPQITQRHSFARVSQFSDINFDGFNLQ